MRHPILSIITTALFLCSLLPVTAQESNFEVELPVIPYLSPEAASLGKYGNIPVSEYTGVPQISIPLHTVRSGELELPVSLSYHASGVKVNQEATWVGLGWDLFAGGCISRVVSGENDLDTNYSPDITQYIDTISNHYIHSNLSSLCVTWDWREWYNGIEESNPNYRLLQELTARKHEPDIFQASFCGQSIMFYLDPVTEEAIQIGKISGNYKIAIDQKQGRDIAVWKITDNYGTIYYFGGEGTEYSYLSDYGVNVPDYAETWNLITIQHAVRGYITLHYGSLYQIFPTPSVSEILRWYDYRNVPSSDPAILNYVAHPAPKVTTRLMKKVYPAQIHTDLEDVFIYTSSREDMGGNPQKIDSIVIKSQQGQDKQLISFFTSYFSAIKYGDESSAYNNHVCRNYKDKRLRFDSLYIDNQKYAFEYNATMLPYKTSNSQDYWGYSNGKSNYTLIAIPNYDRYATYISNILDNSFSNANRLPDIRYSKAGILEKITYPTKGYTTFEYEAHSFHPSFSIDVDCYPYIGTENLAGGLRIKRIQDYDVDGTLSGYKIYTYTDDAGQCSGKLLLPVGQVKHEDLYSAYYQSSGACHCYAYEQHSMSTCDDTPVFTTLNSSPVGYSQVNVEEADVTTKFEFRNTLPTFSPEISGGFFCRSFLIQNLNWKECSSSIVSYLGSDIQHLLDSRGYYVLRDLRNGELTRKSLYKTDNRELFYKEEYTYSLLSDSCIKDNIYADRLYHGCAAVSDIEYNIPLYIVHVYPFLMQRIGTRSKSIHTRNGYDFLHEVASYTYTLQSGLLKTIIKSTSLQDRVRAFEFFYPHETEGAVYNAMCQKNMLNYPTLIRESIGERVISNSYNQFDIINGHPVIKKKMWDNGDGSKIHRMSYRYDPQGCIIEAMGVDSIPVMYLWAYSRNLPVARIEGLRYQDFVSHGGALLAAQLAIAHGINVVEKLIVLRAFVEENFPDALLYTYTFDPTVGILSETSPNGCVTTYNYDSYRRLSSIKNHLGQTLKDFKYNYCR